MNLYGKLLTALGALGLLGVGGTSANASAPANQKVEAPAHVEMQADLSELLAQDVPTRPVEVVVAARFKDRDDKGRPDVFGDPGRPSIGAPGQSGY